MKPKRDSNSFPAAVQELSQLVVGYVRQETIEPIRGLGRFLVWGLAGSIVMGTGIVLLLLGALRFFQTETGDAFDGNLSWVPYLFALAGCVAVAVIALKARGIPDPSKPDRSKPDRSKEES